jgi:hypothetical protein
MGTDPILVAAAQALMHPLSGAQALGPPQGADGQLICVKNWHPMGRTATRARVGLRDDLLGISARLAAGGRLAAASRTAVGQTTRADKLDRSRVVVDSSSKLMRLPHTHIQPKTRSGFPTIRGKSGISLTSTDPAPVKANCPIITPHAMVQFTPRVAPRRTNVKRTSSMPDLAARVMHIRKHHRLTAEHVVIESHSLMRRDVVLDLDPIAEAHLWGND